ncbi:hypothetical protein N7E81_14195 [Reichenbachiella carrageenanivorans]|uniref:Uncharacterized protein n=1 Tax=Reichenbachiella carrageenanivorans TaxID=2979869 RepID=A0ABY6CX61_9BACT|nr:hypothetical protein [Reichenbachiella carrageenanivorans]UXX78509.1 hypothetical protein N7E81_14195 [Reichenbachiella carrageenanivorans]
MLTKRHIVVTFIVFLAGFFTVCDMGMAMVNIGTDAIEGREVEETEIQETLESGRKSFVNFSGDDEDDVGASMTIDRSDFIYFRSHTKAAALLSVHRVSPVALYIVYCCLKLAC